MTAIATIGLDLAKTVFQVHAADDEGSPVLRKRLRRGQVLAFFASIPRRSTNVAPVAMANRTTRVVWAMLSRDDVFRPGRPATA
jgi:transposase